MSRTHLAIVEDVLDYITNGCARALTENTKSRWRGPVRGSYPYVPMATYRLLPLFIRARKLATGNKYARVKFLDAGCGVGITLLIAHACGFDALGLELNRRAITMSKTLTKDMSFEREAVIKQNILTFKGYGDYDVIYYWVPFRDHLKQMRFEKRIAEQMKVGALIIPCGSSHTFRVDRRFRQVNRTPTAYDSSIYRKQRA